MKHLSYRFGLVLSLVILFALAVLSVLFLQRQPAPRAALAPAVSIKRNGPQLSGGGPIPIGQAFAHWYSHHAHARAVCGVAVAPPQWHGGTVTQRTANCTLDGAIHFVRMNRPAPTPQPTFSSPTPTAVPPIPTAVPASCGNDGTGCQQYVLDLINGHRQSVGVPPLTLDGTMSGAPGSSCPGAYGHSLAMAATGQIWHTSASYPAVSFPNGLCASYGWAGENVGYGGAPPIGSMLQMLDSEMWSEPHDAATCASEPDHACNMISANYSRVGIGIVVQGGYVWLTENFAGP